MRVVDLRPIHFGRLLRTTFGCVLTADYDVTRLRRIFHGTVPSLYDRPSNGIPTRASKRAQKMYQYVTVIECTIFVEK